MPAARGTPADGVSRRPWSPPFPCHTHLGLSCIQRAQGPGHTPPTSAPPAARVRPRGSQPVPTTPSCPPRVPASALRPGPSSSRLTGPRCPAKAEVEQGRPSASLTPGSVLPRPGVGPGRPAAGVAVPSRPSCLWEVAAVRTAAVHGGSLVSGPPHPTPPACFTPCRVCPLPDTTNPLIVEPGRS